MAAGTYGHISSPITTQEDWRTNLSRALRTRAYRIFSDETLVRRARANDYTAFDALVARYRSHLDAMELDTGGSEGEAGNALREMMLSAFKDIDSFGAKCAPGTWLYQHGLRAGFARIVR